MDPLKLVHAKTRRAYDAAAQRYHDLFHDEMNEKAYDRLLLVAVKTGSSEGYIQEILGIQAEIYFSLFSEGEISNYFEEEGFAVEFLERRNPYDFEIKNERIFAIGRKVLGKGGPIR